MTAPRFGFQLCHSFDPSRDNVAGWLAEIKYDGQLAMLINGRLIARSLNDITERFPEIEKPTDAVIVGEICVIDGQTGLSDFSKVLQRKRDRGIRIASLAMPATFVAFDILERGGRDLSGQEFRFRRIELEDYLTFPRKGWEIIQQIAIRGNDEVENFRDAAAAEGSEGWILKNPFAPHTAKRTRSFLKVKTWQEEDFTVLALERTVGEKGHPGLVATIRSGGRDQTVNVGGIDNQARIKVGITMTVKFLSKGEDGALRFPTLKQLKGDDRS